MRFVLLLMLTGQVLAGSSIALWLLMPSSATIEASRIATSSISLPAKVVIPSLLLSLGGLLAATAVAWLYWSATRQA